MKAVRQDDTGLGQKIKLAVMPPYGIESYKKGGIVKKRKTKTKAKAPNTSVRQTTKVVVNVGDKKAKPARRRRRAPAKKTANAAANNNAAPNMRHINTNIFPPHAAHQPFPTQQQQQQPSSINMIPMRNQQPQMMLPPQIAPAAPSFAAAAKAEIEKPAVLFGMGDREAPEFHFNDDDDDEKEKEKEKEKKPKETPKKAGGAAGDGDFDGATISVVKSRTSANQAIAKQKSNIIKPSMADLSSGKKTLRSTVAAQAAAKAAAAAAASPLQALSASEEFRRQMSLRRQTISGRPSSPWKR